MNGAAQGEGRVEIGMEGVWGTVCDDGWTVTNSQIVCKELNWFGGVRIGKSCIWQEMNQHPSNLHDCWKYL